MRYADAHVELDLRYLNAIRAHYTRNKDVFFFFFLFSFVLTFRMLGKVFSRHHFEIFSLFFFRK